MTPRHHEDRERLIALVHRFEGRRVAVLGDLVADEFVHGDIARISREAPVPILAHRQDDHRPGWGRERGDQPARTRAHARCPSVWSAGTRRDGRCSNICK